MAKNLFPVLVDLNDKIQNLDQNVLINTIIKRPEVSKLITELNTGGQNTSQLLELHVDAEGISLSSQGGGYSDFTLENARPKKTGRDDINLRQTGDYYKTVKIKFDSLANDYFNIISNPIKDGDNIEENFGGNILGLIDSNWEIVQKFMTPLLIGLLLESVEL